MQSIKYMHVALAVVANEAQELGQSNNVQSPSKRVDKKGCSKKKLSEDICFGRPENMGGGSVGRDLFFLGVLVLDALFFLCIMCVLCVSTSSKGHLDRPLSTPTARMPVSMGSVHAYAQILTKPSRAGLAVSRSELIEPGEVTCF